MLNISKKRRFSGPDDNCPYHIYNFTRKKRGDYVNVWFPGEEIQVKKSKKNYLWDYDTLWTIKKVDKKTAGCLYNREWNPVCMSIHRSYSAFLKDKNSTLCDFRAIIYSIDDSSFAIYWTEMERKDLEPIRLEIMKWIDSQKILNGEEFINYCVSKGANPETIDYN